MNAVFQIGAANRGIVFQQPRSYTNHEIVPQIVLRKSRSLRATTAGDRQPRRSRSRLPDSLQDHRAVSKPDSNTPIDRGCLWRATRAGNLLKFTPARLQTVLMNPPAGSAPLEHIQVTIHLKKRQLLFQSRSSFYLASMQLLPDREDVVRASRMR